MASKQEAQKTTTACPDCGRRIVLKGVPQVGRRFTCIYCGAELKIVKADPVQLGRAYAA
jgi:lysine biosynthesis protein LysW